jgi:PAS domain S-box-containing protein
MSTAEINFKNELQAANVRQLALRLAEAEHSLQVLTAGGIDAFVDSRGNTHLLRPEQDRLRRNEARLQTLLDSVPDVITVLNEAGEICYQSPAVTRVLGYAAGTLFGRRVFEFIHPDDLPAFERAFSEVIRHIRPSTTAEFRHRARDGSWCALEAALSSLPRSTETAGVILTCRDMTHRRQAQEESARREAALAQASLAKDRFLAMLSHELRTPLTPALLGVQALQEDGRFAEAEPTLAMIRRNIELQSRLLEELLDFTHVSQGKLRLRLESIDAHTAVHNVLEICHTDIASRQIAVRLDLRAAESHVHADSPELQQILWNLVRNAVKFSEPGGILAISSANDQPGSLSLEFVDYGIGIEPEILPIVFDSFQQGDRSMQQLYGGLGLGMFIAKGLAEAQEGTLSAASEGRGKGATFRLTLKTAPALQPPGELRTPAPPVDRLHILLVEDHDDTRAVLARLLERRGHTVFPAQNIATALLLAESCEFDFLISDIGLPDGTGYELMARLRLLQPSLNGIALSGFGMASDIEKSRAAGFSEHLVKPVAFESLRAAIQTVAAKMREARDETAGHFSQPTPS